ncbi:ADP-ribosylglycohydrolase family protein [Saccharopolyspora sp. NPDC000995]
MNHPQAAVRHPDADRCRWADVKHENFAHVKGEGFRHWGPGWQQRVAGDARIRAESLGYHQPDRPHTPEPVPQSPPRSTPESMAAERAPENPFEHRWNNGVGEHEKLDISGELRTKLGGTGLGIRNTGSGLSMIRHSRQGYYGGADFAQRMPRPSVDPKRFTVEVHGSPDGVTFNGQQLSAEELAEIIKGAPGYKEGAPVRLLSCRTGADLPDGSPNFAQQLSKELGVEVLAPNKDAWVDNFGNMYASGSRAEFHPDAFGTPQPRFDEPGEWVSFSPDGTKEVHESPLPPGHEPEWTRFGHQADAAHQRGFFSNLFGRKREDSFEFDPVSGENLQIAVYIGMASDYVREALLLAMNYTEHRSVVGAISGMLIGADFGVQAIPSDLRAPLVLGDAIETLAKDALVEFSPGPPTDEAWLRRYPAW